METQLDSQLLLRALLDADRLVLLGLLAGEALDVPALAARTGQRTVDIQRHVDLLVQAGLLQVDKTRYRLDRRGIDQHKRSLFAGQRPPKPVVEGLEEDAARLLANYLNPDGTLTHIPAPIPAKAKVFKAILQYVVQPFKPGENYTEKQVNELLSRYFNDPVALRRYLIDAHLLERARDGSRYWLPEPVAAPTEAAA